ncbi:zinc ribbon domain-containing protein [bacterium]|nr:zinc ribbon domain-containing protein [candidate division CSSED10-310 bacterium]
MPLYEYKCSICEYQFEKLESFHADASTRCPKCGSNSKRILSLGTFILKGSGWYATEHPNRSANSKDTKVPSSCGSQCESCCGTDQKSA